VLYLSLGEVTVVPVKEFSRKQTTKKKSPVTGKRESDDDRNNRKTSLRIGTSRKGRGAELSSRRGSLKKKDRRADKAAKAEAALERKTVYLPEYVVEAFCCLHRDSILTIGSLNVEQRYHDCE
jgi:hypothetical protein